MAKRILSAVILSVLVLLLSACSPETLGSLNDLSKDSSSSQPVNSVEQGIKENSDTGKSSSENSKTESVKSEQSSANRQTDNKIISKDKAKSIAFKHAGVKSADVYDFEIDLDRDYGEVSYEIEFRSAKIEYEYDIHAYSGEILKAEKDGLDIRNKSDSAESLKTRDEVKNIALNHAGLKADKVYDLEIELDRDNGKETYEIEFKSGRTEYKYDIDAKTGKILKSHKEIDD